MKRPFFIGGVVVLTAAIAASLLFVFSDFLGFRSAAIRDDQVVAVPRPDGPVGDSGPEGQQSLTVAPVPAPDASIARVEDDAPAGDVEVPAGELTTSAVSEGPVPSSPDGELAVAPVGQPGGHVVAGAAAGPDGAAGGLAVGGNKPEDRALADVVDRPLADVEQQGVVALRPNSVGVEPPDPVEGLSQLAEAPAGGAGLVVSKDEIAEVETDSVEAALVGQPVPNAVAAVTQLDARPAEKLLLDAELVEKPVVSGGAGSVLAARGEPEADLPVGEVVADAASLTGSEVAPILEPGGGAAEAESGSSGRALVAEPLPGAVTVETQLDDLAVAEKLSLGTELVEEPVASGEAERALAAREESEGVPPAGDVVADAVSLSGSDGTPTPESGSPVTGGAATSEIVSAIVAEGSTEQALRAGAVLDSATIGGGSTVDRPASSGGPADAVNDGADVGLSAIGSQLAAAPATVVIEAPEFDIVRIDRFGNTVIAGRSSPSCEVTVHDQSEIIGVVTADRRGEWVLLPIEPLRPGDRQLSLSADCGSAGYADSERVVIVVVPETGADVAGRPTDDRTDVLALSVPRSGNGLTRVLQAPIAEGAEPASGRVLPAVSLTAIDYGPDGKLSLSGEAEPGAALNVYLDNALVGSAKTDVEGRWSVTPEIPVAPGLYTLRADQLADTGKVEARVEVPFLRADPLTELPVDRFVVVQPGNSLWRLARRTYGLGIQYTVIFQANAKQIRDPDLIYPGQIFMLPQTN